MSRMRNIENLSGMLRLSPYQTYILDINYYKYNLSRLVKRGGVLYAPYATGAGLRNRMRGMFLGVPADLIGPDRMLVRGCRRIKFYAAGCFCARMGREKYYSDATGQRLNRDAFMQTLRNMAH